MSWVHVPSGHTPQRLVLMTSSRFLKWEEAQPVDETKFSAVPQALGFGLPAERSEGMLLRAKWYVEIPWKPQQPRESNANEPIRPT